LELFLNGYTKKISKIASTLDIVHGTQLSSLQIYSHSVQTISKKESSDEMLVNGVVMLKRLVSEFEANLL
jgi:hypothetical protein